MVNIKYLWVLFGFGMKKNGKNLGKFLNVSF